MSKKDHKLPRIFFLLRLFIGKSKAHLLENHFEEIYDEIFTQKGRFAANRWLCCHFISSLPSISIYGSITMFKNYLKIALRNIKMQKIYSLINIGGLGLGMACFTLIFLWVTNELSYDNFHNDKDKIYRITCHGFFQGKEIHDIGTPAPLAPALIEELPDIEHAARIRLFPRLILKHGSNTFYEDQILGVDPSFLEIFNFPFISGNPKTALSQILSVVITKETAQKYFGEENPVNKSINIEGRISCKVTGVIENVPSNSSLKFDFLVPYQCVEAFKICGLGWGDPNFWTYIKLKGISDEREIGKKMTQIAKNHRCPYVVKYHAEFLAQPLKQVYLNPVGNYDFVKGNIRYVYIFSIIGLFILAIACINFINLSTARYEKRAREIGLRKVLGAHRSQLIKQLLGESFFMVCISLAFALILIKLLMPLFNNLTGKNLTLNFLDTQVYLILLIITLLTGFFAGLYPSLYLSSFSPVVVIKGSSGWGSFLKKYRTPIRGKSFRNILVVIQFAVSIILIICTAVVFNQLQFISENTWKMEKHCIIHIPVKENIGIKYDFVKEQLLTHPEILSVAVKDSLPTKILNWTGEVSWEGRATNDERIVMETTRVGDDYFQTMGIDIVQGRNFSRKIVSDNQAFILNEEAVTQMGMENPIGKTFALYGRKGPIIGVVKNTFFQSFKLKYPPQVFHMLTNLQEQAFEGAVFIKVGLPDSSSKRKTISATLTHIENVWKQVNSLAPFEYHFLDETIESQYRKEQHLRSLFGIFALLAIIISCLGLYGLASYTAEYRTKEIAIRKVLGASILEVLVMLTREYFKWVVLANIIAWPVAYYAMNEWLQGFTYRTIIGPFTFIIAGMIALLIALTTVYYQSFKAASKNPVESLKYQ